MKTHMGSPFLPSEGGTTREPTTLVGEQRADADLLGMTASAYPSRSQPKRGVPSVARGFVGRYPGQGAQPPLTKCGGADSGREGMGGPDTGVQKGLLVGIDPPRWSPDRQLLAVQMAGPTASQVMSVVIAAEQGEVGGVTIEAPWGAWGSASPYPAAVCPLFISLPPPWGIRGLSALMSRQ